MQNLPKWTNEHRNTKRNPYILSLKYILKQCTHWVYCKTTICQKKIKKALNEGTAFLLWTAVVGSKRRLFSWERQLSREISCPSRVTSCLSGVVSHWRQVIAQEGQIFSPERQLERIVFSPERIVVSPETKLYSLGRENYSLGRENFSLGRENYCLRNENYSLILECYFNDNVRELSHNFSAYFFFRCVYLVCLLRCVCTLRLSRHIWTFKKVEKRAIIMTHVVDVDVSEVCYI